MSVSVKNLFESQFAQSSLTTVYIAPSNTVTIIDCLSATNTTGSPVNLTVCLVPFGASASTGNTVISSQSIAAGLYVEVFTKPQVLNAGDYISITDGAGSSTVVRGSGREVSQ